MSCVIDGAEKRGKVMAAAQRIEDYALPLHRTDVLRY
jgi:hypothetical protein